MLKETQDVVRHSGGAPYLLRIARNAAITAGGTLFGQLLGPVIGVVTTRALGAELYGLYTLLVQWGGFAAELAKAGFGAALVRFVGVYRARGELEKLKGAIGAGLRWVGLVGGVLTLGVLVASEPISQKLLRHPEAVPALQFYGPAIVLTALYGIVLAVLTGFQQQRFVQVSSIVGSIVKLASLLVLLWAGAGLYAALGSSLLQDAAVLLLGMLFLRRVFPEFWTPTVPVQTEWRALIWYGLTVFATSLFYRYTFQLDVLVLGMFRSAAEVGLYAVALRLQPLLTLPTYALGETFNPVVAELFARKERGALQTVYRSTVRWSLLLTFPLMLPLLMVPEVVLRLFGAEFASAAPVLRWVSVGTWLGAAFGVAGYVLNMAGKPQVNLVNGILTAAVNLGLFFWLIPRFGMLGAAWTYAAVNVGVALLRMGQVWWLLKLHPWDAVLGRAFGVVAVALMGGFLVASLAGGWLGTLAGLGIFGVLLPGGVGRDDRELWLQWRRHRES